LDLGIRITVQKKRGVFVLLEKNEKGREDTRKERKEVK
jgi:hypothetical protein